MKEKIDDTQRRQKEQEREMTSVTSDLEDKINNLECRSREYSIRLKVVKNLDGRSDYIKVVAEILVKQKLVDVSVDKTMGNIEHAHPLGPPKNGSIIARLFSRPLKKTIIQRAKQINKDAEVRIVEDLTKQDFMLKTRAYAQMQHDFKQGSKARFQRGKLFINGQEVPINL